MKQKINFILCIIVFISMVMASCKDQHKPDSKNLDSQSIFSNKHKDSVKQFIHDYMNDIWNKRDFSNADKYWGQDFKNVFAPQFDHGPESMKKQVAYFLSAFDPFHFELKDMMIDENKVSLWIEISGTHTGELFGIKPTHKQVKFREAVWYSLKDGKLDEVYPFVDWYDLFEQLGQYPEMTH